MLGQQRPHTRLGTADMQRTVVMRRPVTLSGPVTTTALRAMLLVLASLSGGTGCTPRPGATSEYGQPAASSQTSDCEQAWQLAAEVQELGGPIIAAPSIADRFVLLIRSIGAIEELAHRIPEDSGVPGDALQQIRAVAVGLRGAAHLADDEAKPDMVSAQLERIQRLLEAIPEALRQVGC